jgi:hypothetical protein
MCYVNFFRHYYKMKSFKFLPKNSIIMSQIQKNLQSDDNEQKKIVNSK